MILIAGVLLTALGVVAAGGRLSALAEARFRFTWTLVAGLMLQVLIISVVPDRWLALHAPAHIVSYVLIAGFFLGNARQPGMVIMASGWLCNFAAIAANGGVMPAAPQALATAGIAPTDGFANSAAAAAPRLPWLGDVFALPASWPLANVYSVGDVLLLIGAAVLLVRYGFAAPAAARAARTGSAEQRGVGAPPPHRRGRRGS